MTGRGEIFIEQVRQAQALDMGILTMPSHTEARMDARTANTLTWPDFKERIQPIGSLHLGNTGLECLIIPKNIGWSTKDVTIFAGEHGADINEIDNLDVNQGSAFLAVNSFLAEELVKRGERLVQVSIGFNPNDFSAGHHTNAKLHSHIRAVPHAIDLERRQSFKWKEMRRFDRLAFIEPFAPLHHDFIVEKIANGALADFLTEPPQSHLGYTSLTLSKEPNLGYTFPEIKRLYGAMKEEYALVSSIFTDGTRDHLGRFIPRPPHERLDLLAAYLENRTYYSEQSVKTLVYLADNIKKAMPRAIDDPYDISSPGMAYITRGFAGAMTFNFTEQNNSVTLDFFPRVISTTPVGKTILGKGLPTVINKTTEPASEKEKQVTTAFHMSILEILANEFGDAFETSVSL